VSDTTGVRHRFGIATGSWPERDDWPAAIARATQESWRVVELTAITVPRLTSLLRDLPNGALDGFDRVSLHAPVLFETSASAWAHELTWLAREHDVILHPDVYRDEAWLESLGPRAVFENMDAVKSFGRDVADLRGVFERFPAAGFCLDVAHVWTNDRTLALGHELLDAFGERLRQLHVSGIEPDGRHRETTAADLELYEPLLGRCSQVPWVLEAELVDRTPEPGSS